jgi:hypothetical protein
LENLEATRLGGSKRELPRSPSKEGDDDKEGYDGVCSETITGTPEEVELEDEEYNDGDSNVEADTVTGFSAKRTTRSTISILGSIELTLAVELVEPDDDKGGNTKEDKVKSILGSRVTRSHIGTVHTVDIENTNNGDNNIDEPIIIYKAGDSRRTVSDVLFRVVLGSSEDIEYYGKEDNTKDEVSPENAAAELVLEERERSALFNGFLLSRGISATDRRSCRVCNHLNS